ncbi:hypothetical protein O181_001692 [Austropuccinia psidii MF-1]|uniref:Uncharacterized protein n=1 Tax=Austropuccinia psidii MF-1 TaxID=1389203 RepID=A0A9Q3BB33_9BASI|nr:hypothetical protein [Austropuccinia psidii MF-1]
MSWFFDYSTNQILLQFLPRNWDLIQDPHQGTSEIWPGEDSEIPSPPSYFQLPNCPLRSPNRPHICRRLTIIGLQVKSLHSICQHMAPTPSSESSSMASLGFNQSFVGTNSGPSQLTAEMDDDHQSLGNDSDDSALPEKTNCSSVYNYFKVTFNIIFFVLAHDYTN